MSQPVLRVVKRPFDTVDVHPSRPPGRTVTTVTMWRRQELFLDAIEESMLMVEVAYERLVRACVVNTMQTEPGAEDLDEREKKLFHNELLSQAWLIVDAAPVAGIGDSSARTSTNSCSRINAARHRGGPSASELHPAP